MKDLINQMTRNNFRRWFSSCEKHERFCSYAVSSMTRQYIRMHMVSNFSLCPTDIHYLTLVLRPYTKCVNHSSNWRTLDNGFQEYIDPRRIADRQIFSRTDLWRHIFLHVNSYCSFNHEIMLCFYRFHRVFINQLHCEDERNIMQR